MYRRKSSIGSDLSYDEMSEDSSDAGMTTSSSSYATNTFTIWDATRENSCDIEAGTLTELIINASAAFGIPVARVCLEQDGTEIDEDEYFCTLESETAIMVLKEDERWLPFSTKYEMGKEDAAGGATARKSSLCGDDELEILSNMDPDCLTDIVPDKLFLEVVREACQQCITSQTTTTTTAQEAI